MSQSTFHAASWPRAAASAAVFRDGQVLLIRRSKGLLQGLWSLPGGHIEPGETARAAAEREVAEETSVSADIRSFVDLHEVILRDSGGGLTGHYLIAVHAGVWSAGEPKAGGDASEAAFVPIDRLGSLALTEGAEGFVRRAWTLLFGAEAA